jgi:hypothetical protein
MRTGKIFSIISLSIALAACAVVVPVVDKDAAASATSTCKTYTNSMSLKVYAENIGGSCNTNECAVAALAVFAGSAIISGCIVITNNTVHWLEYQGSCSDGFLNSAKQRFLDSVNNPKPIPAVQPDWGA